MKRKALYRISTSAMVSAISKLRLERGDALLVRDVETLRYLEHFRPPVDFIVPIVFSPQGVEKLSRADLLNLIEQLDQEPGGGKEENVGVAPV